MLSVAGEPGECAHKVPEAQHGQRFLPPGILEPLADACHVSLAPAAPCQPVLCQSCRTDVSADESWY